MAEQVTEEQDNKLRGCVEIVRGLLREGYHPVIWCYYVETAEYVAQSLQRALAEEFPEARVLCLTGRVGEEERRLRVDKLIGEPRRVLVATDCLSEGINLQHGFNAVVHYDLPWNPNRLEQREGRVDRYGQQTPAVKAIRYYGVDNPVDGAVIRVLLDKARQIRETLGTYVPIPEEERLVYVPTATIAYINHGWKGRPQGFVVDLSSGELFTDSEVESGELRGGPPADRHRLRLWVQETQNLLLIRLLDPSLQGNEVLQTSLQYALKRGIEQTFQLEERELGVTRVGEGEWRSLLFYEAAEGELGVLRRLVEEVDALPQVAQAALSICHYDLDGNDRAERCVQACYECLLSYTNQLEASFLDRRAIRDLLRQLTTCQVRPRINSRSSEEHLASLRSQTQSAFEREFLDFLAQNGYRLPDDAQKSIQEPRCIADFFYAPNVLVFCDGPPHDTPGQRRIDDHLRRELIVRGWRVIVIRWNADLSGQVQHFPEVFGRGL
jgi:hypothetical protein